MAMPRVGSTSGGLPRRVQQRLERYDGAHHGFIGADVDAFAVDQHRHWAPDRSRRRSWTVW